MKAVKGVLFDKDGVLVDFDLTWGPSSAAVIRHFAGGDETKARRMAAAIDFDFDAERFLPDSVFIAGTGADTLLAWAEILDMKADAALAGRIIDRMTAEGTARVAHAADVPGALDALRGMGLPLGIATNDQEASARAQMGKLGLTDRFTTIWGADSGYGAKPKPGMIEAFAAHLNVKPARVMMIGDSLHDIHAARAAGAIAVGIGTGPADIETLRPEADHVIEVMADLPGLVGMLNG